MKNTDLVKFLVQRIKRDRPKVFIFRLIRFAIILPYKIKMWLWWNSKSKPIHGGQVCFIQGSRMELGKETGITRDLLYNRIREPFANKRFAGYIKEGDVVIDIGANIGYYALQEARLVGEFGKVYAIEPVAESVGQLRHNIELNNYKNIEVFEMALGNFDGTATLNITKESNLCYVSEGTGRVSKESRQVPIATLDKFIEGRRYPNVIRMDVEGYEREIIRGMRGILFTSKPLILFIELHLDILDTKVTELAMILKAHGFEVLSASVEPHPAVMKSKLGTKLTAFCDRQIGFPQGYGPLTIDELINNDLYSSGQIEWLEVIFGR